MSGHLPTTAETHPFLVRGYRGQVFQAPRLLVQWREVRRVKRERQSPIGTIREMEFHRWDKSQLHVTAAGVFASENPDEKGPRVVSAIGGDHRQGEGDVCPNSTAGVAKVARRIVPEDAAAITEVDHEILRLQDRIADLRRQRSELVTAAWRNGKRFAVIHDLRPETDDRHALRYVDTES